MSVVDRAITERIRMLIHSFSDSKVYAFNLRTLTEVLNIALKTKKEKRHVK